MDAARDQVSSIQPNTHSFVVKVWLADPAPVAGRIAWRGRITHVPSGRTHHFVKLSENAVYVAPYLEQRRSPRRPTASRRSTWASTGRSSPTR